MLVQCLSEVKSSSLEASALASNFYFPFGKFIMFFLFSLLKKKINFLARHGWYTLVVPTHGRQRERDYHEFEVKLVYIHIGNLRPVSSI